MRDAAADAQSILLELRAQANAKHRANVLRLGIPESNSLGVPMPVIRKIAKTLPASNELAAQLWASQLHEARLLAALVFEPGTLSRQQLDELLQDVISWDLCDHLCGSIFASDPDYQQLIERWVPSEQTYFKRAGYALMAVKATHERELEAELIDRWLTLIEQHGGDARVHVKKAASWALREIGHLGIAARDQAIASAQAMIDGTDKKCQWVGRDALKELSDLMYVPHRRRLVSSGSKAARSAEEML